jgi:hypothetical protein
MFNQPTTGEGQDPMSAYSQLDPNQRTQVAQEFIQRFKGTNDSQAQQYANLNPQSVSPGQLAEMHQYAAQKNPGILGEVMHHKVMAVALGGFAAYEIHKHTEEKK